MNLQSEFDRCWPWLAAALERAGNTHGKEDLYQEIERGNAQLFPLPHGAFVTEQRTFPRLRECHFWLAGGDLQELRKVEPLTLQWARSLGCQRARMHGRKGWVRALPAGWEEVGTILIKELS